MKAEKRQNFAITMENMKIVSSMLKDYGLTIHFKNDKAEHKNFSMNTILKIVTVPKTLNYASDVEISSICHEIGHYIDRNKCYRNYKKDSWKKVIYCEIKAWKLGRKEYIKYFGKDFTEDMKNHSIFALLSHIGYQRYRYINERIDIEAKKLVQEGKAKNIFLAKMSLYYKIPIISDSSWISCVNNKERLEKKLIKILEY